MHSIKMTWEYRSQCSGHHFLYIYKMKWSYNNYKAIVSLIFHNGTSWSHYRQVKHVNAPHQICIPKNRHCFFFWPALCGSSVSSLFIVGNIQVMSINSSLNGMVFYALALRRERSHCCKIRLKQHPHSSHATIRTCSESLSTLVPGRGIFWHCQGIQ